MQTSKPLSESQIEQEIEQSNPTAPRLTPEFIDSKIKKVEYQRPTERMTLCILTLENGTEVTGESFCACPENYVQKTGEDVAYKNAREKIWPLEGYILRERLYGNNA